MNLIILSGVAGVGKSTYVEQYYPNATIISSDAIKIELGHEGPNDKTIFAEVYRRVRNAMIRGDETIVADATFLTRKSRLALISQTAPKQYGYTVTVIQLHKPLKLIQDQNKQRKIDQVVPRDVVRQMYLSMQPARVGLDCDEYILMSPSIDAYTYEMNKGINEPHHSLYHYETIQEHIDMTIAESIKRYGESSPIVEIATWHDLGKSVARTTKQTKKLVSKYVTQLVGGYDTYVGHENVSAMYYQIAKGDPDIVDVILNHMVAHKVDDLNTSRTIRRQHLSKQVITYLEQFREIDRVSKRCDQTLIAIPSELFKLYEGDTVLAQLLNNEDVTVSVNTIDPHNPLFTFKYKHAGVDFHNILTRNARALTLDKNGTIVTIGFEKFFNYKQLGEEYDDDFRYECCEVHTTKPITAWEKLDGTLIVLGVYQGKFVASTTMSTKTDFSINAQHYFESHPNADKIKQYMIDHDLCFMFEYTSPENQIVVPYEETKYTFLGARKRDIYDHRVVRLVDADINALGLCAAHSITMTFDELVAYQHTNTTSEGFVVENDYGRLVKFKTNYWFEQSHKMFGFFFGDPYSKSKRILLADAIRNDTIDDIVAFDNQRLSETHPVVDFKRAWDAKLAHYQQLATQYEHLDDKALGLIKLDKLDKQVLFALRKGNLFQMERLCHNLAHKIVKDMG